MAENMFAIYWLLVGPREVASSRIHGYRIHEYLKSCGYYSEILSSPLHWASDSPLWSEDLDECPFLRPGDIVVVQKLQGPRTVDLLKGLSQRNVKTVYLDSDLPLKLDEAREASCVVCSSEHLAALYREQGLNKVESIPDAYELCRPPKAPSTSGPLRCVWFGAAEPLRWYEVETLKALLRTRQLSRWELITISNHDIANVRWELPASWDLIHEADAVAITGNDYPWSQVKSANRPIQAMALGVPTVAYPLPSYKAVIQHGRTGYLCRSPREWQAAFKALLNPNVRKSIATKAYSYSSRIFSIERIGELWCHLFGALTKERLQVTRTAVRDSPSALNPIRSKIYRRLGESLAPYLLLHQNYLDLQNDIPFRE